MILIGVYPPERLFVNSISKELLEFPSHRHPRIELGLDLSASIFVGGGSIEGTVQIKRRRCRANTL